VANRKNIQTVRTPEIMRAIQNPYLSRRYGKSRNIGSVGSTYQKV